MTVEIWFFDTPYVDLIKLRDWKGILLKAHINWLGQRLTHCAIRINLSLTDVVYQATWGKLLACETKDILITPAEVIEIDNTVISDIEIIDRLMEAFKTYPDTKIYLSDLLHLMWKKPHKVKRIICTSFIYKMLGLNFGPTDLYPDNCYGFIKLLGKDENNK